MNPQKAIKQLKELKKLGKTLRLAADGWNEDWKTLIATLMSARTTDKKTIPTAENLFSNFQTLKKLSNAKINRIENIIRPVNFYKTKSKNIKNLALILVKDYNSKVPHNFNKLTELPGVGRKTANVFLAEYGHNRIGIDTHVTYCSKKLGWTKHKDQKKIEKDLEKLFPKKYWKDLNWILVRFGQTYTNRKEKDRILKKIKSLS